MNAPVSNKEYVLKALATKVLPDFKQWLMADTKPLQDWKERKIAIKICSNKMMDDAEGMITQYRTRSDDQKLPILLVAIASIVMPPDKSQVIGVPYFLNTIIDTDPQKRHVKIRSIASAFRVQLLFLSPDEDSVSSFLNQFVAYMDDNYKRRFGVEYRLTDDVYVEWDMTVFDNSLFPDSDVIEQKNLYAGVVDFNIAGLIPNVVGLNPIGKVAADGQTFYSDANVDAASRDPGTPEWDLIVEADLFTDALGNRQLRAKADKVTFNSTTERVD